MKALIKIKGLTFFSAFLRSVTVTPLLSSAITKITSAKAKERECANWQNVGRDPPSGGCPSPAHPSRVPGPRRTGLRPPDRPSSFHIPSFNSRSTPRLGTSRSDDLYHPIASVSVPRDWGRCRAANDLGRLLKARPEPVSWSCAIRPGGTRSESNPKLRTPCRCRVVCDWDHPPVGRSIQAPGRHYRTAC